jgi:hypothetical protein
MTDLALRRLISPSRRRLLRPRRERPSSHSAGENCDKVASSQLIAMHPLLS